jgi:hypothetical protein
MQILIVILNVIQNPRPTVLRGFQVAAWMTKCDLTAYLSLFCRIHAQLNMGSE